MQLPYDHYHDAKPLDFILTSNVPSCKRGCNS